MTGISGPPLAAWNAEKYVISWLKSGKHGALDKATGLAKKTSCCTTQLEIVCVI